MAQGQFIGDIISIPSALVYPMARQHGGHVLETVYTERAAGSYLCFLEFIVLRQFVRSLV